MSQRPARAPFPVWRQPITPRTRSVAVITPDDAVVGPVCDAVRAVDPGAQVERASLDDLVPHTRLVVVDEDAAPAAVAKAAIVAPSARVIVLWRRASVKMLTLASEVPAVVGLLDAHDGPMLMYAARRVLVPTEPAPTGHDLMPWGSTAVMWRPSSTGQSRKIVQDLERVARRTGLTRRSCNTLSLVGHELLMNAIYDAPVDEHGAPLHAADRAADVVLDGQQTPTLALWISCDQISLDATDPFGKLTSGRFFASLARGLNSHRSGVVTLDTSHGGAGLGMFTIFRAADVLRVEVTPGRSTQVSWTQRRAPKSEADIPSIFFFSAHQG
ncbi:MAG: hypothetical protein KTR31_28390 [Myxococcales bacterium]|nr:hypothetical protein [Myxococcales bacterium]